MVVGFYYRILMWVVIIKAIIIFWNYILQINHLNFHFYLIIPDQPNH